MNQTWRERFEALAGTDGILFEGKRAMCSTEAIARFIEKERKLAVRDSLEKIHKSIAGLPYKEEDGLLKKRILSIIQHSILGEEI